MKKKLLKQLLLLFLVGLGAWVLFVFFRPSPQFTPELWAETRWQERHRLVDSLMDNYDLEGMTREEVKELLGEPDRDGKGSFEYRIQTDFIFDWRVFYLEFSNDRVVEYGTSVPDW